jgi:phenylalanyl-tRNA synthetase beta chain
MAGIMGGASTAVQADTRDIYLEAAFFAPIAIAGRARTYGMHTDAGHRFERGVDYQGQVRAMERATELLLLIAGGRPGPLVDTVSESDLPQAIEVRLRAARVARVLGMVIKAADIENILKRLEFEFAVDPASDDKAWLVQSPSHRFDINIEADLIEEISRIIGYEALPVTQPVATLSMLEATETRSSAKRMKQRLIDRGYSEAINYSFVDSDLQQLLLPDATAVALKNPLSTEMSVMRTTLVGGLLKALVHNQNRQQTNVRLFEIGLVFHQHDQTALSFDTIKQQEHLALVLSGQRLPEGWANTSHMVDFFDLKGDLEALLGTQGISFQACEISGLQAGQSARILKDNVPLGRIGLLDASVASQFDLRAPAYVAEIDLSLALRQDVPSVQEVSKYPEVRRDIAILVARSVTATSLRTVIAASAGDALLHLKLFDVYMGKGIDPNQKSVGLGLTFQHPSRTLTDEEINTAMAEVVQALASQLQAQLR